MSKASDKKEQISTVQLDRLLESHREAIVRKNREQIFMYNRMVEVIVTPLEYEKDAQHTGKLSILLARSFAHLKSTTGWKMWCDFRSVHNLQKLKFPSATSVFSGIHLYLKWLKKYPDLKNELFPSDIDCALLVQEFSKICIKAKEKFSER